MKVRNRTPGRTGSRTCSRRLGRTCGRLRPSAGFTLTELVVVMVVVGMLAATVGIKFGSLGSSTNLRTAIAQVANDLRFLQCQSMATIAYSGGNTVFFPGGGTSYLLPTVFPQGATYIVRAEWKPLPTGVTINSGLMFSFNSLGEYNSYTDAVVVLNSRGLTGSIKIRAISGNVEAY